MARVHALCISALLLSLAGGLPAAPSISKDDFMSNWMGALMPAIGNATVLDLSMPGTHDTVRFLKPGPLAPTLMFF